jgi:hypothetical protein
LAELYQFSGFTNGQHFTHGAINKLGKACQNRQLVIRAIMPLLAVPSTKIQVTNFVRLGELRMFGRALANLADQLAADSSRVILSRVKKRMLGVSLCGEFKTK